MLLVTNCSNDGKSDKSGLADSTKVIGNTIVSNTTNTAKSFNEAKSEKTFFDKCNKWDERFAGRLMGLESRSIDSTSHLCFSVYYGKPETYEIIFCYKNSVEKRMTMQDTAISNDFFNGCNSLYANFECFAFIINMINPQKQKDLNTSAYTFPSHLKIYKRLRNDQWTVVGEQEVLSYKDYRNLQFKTIYGLQ